MPEPAIAVENLSKRYHIGALRKRGDLRDSLARAALHPLLSLRRFGRSSTREEDVIWALRDVSFEVEQGGVLGVIGANGAGKSTLLKVLSRITEPTSGRAVLRGRVASLLEVGTGFHQELTGRENVYLSGAILGLKKAEIDARFDQIVEFCGLARFIDTPVKRYSSGMRVRLGFAVAAHLDPDILLVDEVLAVGDAAFQRKCLGKMESLERGGRTVIFVSHNMASIKHLCTSALWLHNGRGAAFGDPGEVTERYLQSASPQDDAGTQFVFEPPAPEPRPEAWITRIELRDNDGRPLRSLGTGDGCTVRISFTCHQPGNYGIFLGVQTPAGAPLLGYETNNPDGMVLACPGGEHRIEVQFPSLPLGAGQYWVGAGVSRPGHQWLHRVRRAGRFEVQPKDVFGTGRPIPGSLSLLCIPHSWHIPESDDGIRILK